MQHIFKTISSSYISFRTKSLSRIEISKNCLKYFTTKPSKELKTEVWVKLKKKEHDIDTKAEELYEFVKDNENKFFKNPVVKDKIVRNNKTLEFKELGLPKILLQRLQKIGMITPSHVQTLVIPSLNHLLHTKPIFSIKNNHEEETTDDQKTHQNLPSNEVTYAKGRDILFRSSTGTGKTLAYLLPLLTFILKSTNNTKLPTFPFLIITPSRELSNQVSRELNNLVQTLNKEVNGIEITPVTLLGDEDINSQVKKISSYLNEGKKNIENSESNKKKIYNILIGTPTRILNLFEQFPAIKEIFYNQIKCIILDEVDHLIKPLSKYATISTKKQRKLHPKPTEEILNAILLKNPFVNIVGCSATVNRPSISLFSSKWKTIPKVIKSDGNQFNNSNSSSILESSNHPQIPPTISHSFIICNPTSHYQNKLLTTNKENKKNQGSKLPVILNNNIENKLEILCSLFQQELLLNDPNINSKIRFKITSALVFIPSEMNISDFVARVNKREPSLNAVPLYKYFGLQNELSKILEFEDKFKSGEIKMVVANEDIGRGINFSWLEYVILFEPPKPNMYLHLAGRVGRLGKKGLSISLFSEEQKLSMKQLQKYFNFNFIPLSGFTQ